MPELYFFHSSPAAQRLRLALGYKQVAYRPHALAYDDDETFFELGIARTVPVLRLEDGRLLTDSLAVLRRIDELFPDTPPLVDGRIDADGWQALLDWRQGVDAVLSRLHAPVLPAYGEVSADENTLAAYKAHVQHRFGMSVEELANDRYAGFEQLYAMTRMKSLAAHLAHSGYYMGQPSIADMVLTADLYPLQLLDGVSLPLDLMYYFRRVEEACHVALAEDLTVSV